MIRSLPLVFCVALAGCSIETSGLLREGEDGGNRRDGGTREGGPRDGGPDTGRDACGACECRGDLECPAPTMGTWGECTVTPGGDLCAQNGNQMRVDREWRCVSGVCTEFTNTFSQPCTISTDGTVCGSVLPGPWGECTGGGGCSTTGTRSRSVTQMVCRGGSCASESAAESESCTVDTSGVRCEGFASCWGRCEGTECRAATGCSRDSDCGSVCPPGCTPDCVMGIGSCCWCHC